MEVYEGQAPTGGGEGGRMTGSPMGALFSSPPAFRAQGVNGPHFLRRETRIRAGCMPGFIGKLLTFAWLCFLGLI